MNNQNPTSGSLPDYYQEVLSWKVTGKTIRVIALNTLGVILFVIFGVIFSSLAVGLGKLPSEASFRLGLSEISLVIVGIMLTFVLHELIHGLAMQMFGARPKYGIIWKGLMLYATSPGYAYHRNNYVVIALAPFVFISMLVILGMWLLQGTSWVALLGICGIVNASGAIGDMWIAMIVLRYAATACVVDERDGIRLFLPKPCGDPKKVREHLHITRFHAINKFTQHEHNISYPAQCSTVKRMNKIFLNTFEPASSRWRRRILLGRWM